MIAVVALDNALASQAFMPLVGMAENEDTARLITVAILVIQAVLVIASTRLLGMITSSAVGIELGIIVVLVIALAVVMVFTGSWCDRSNLAVLRGTTVDAPNYFATAAGSVHGRDDHLLERTLVGFGLRGEPG